MSAHQPETLVPLKEKLQGKTSLFSGPSGVGKSSLLNALSPGLDLKTGSISESNDTGKHTTTFAEMFLIDNTTRFIDTPGVKSFGIVDLKREEVARYFTDLFNLSHHCKFNNCTHVNEPGCAVKQALENGELAEFRYQNYLNIFESEDDYKEEWE